MNTTTPSHRTYKSAARRPARRHTTTAVTAAGIIALGGLGAGVIGTLVVHSAESSSVADIDPAIAAGDFSVAFGPSIAAALTPPVNPFVNDFSVAFGPRVGAATTLDAESVESQSFPRRTHATHRPRPALTQAAVSTLDPIGGDPLLIRASR